MGEPTVKLVYGVVLDGTETVTFDEGGGVLTATLDAGTYWCHNSTHATYPGLYEHIATKMTAASASAYTYQVSHGTPTLSSAWAGFGCRIDETGANAWTWRPAGTINASELLGWKTTDSNTAATGGTVTSPRTYRGAWRATEPVNFWASTPEQRITPSTENVERTDAYFFDQGSRQVRDVQVQHVVAAHVYKQRAKLSAFAVTGELTLGDTNNAIEHAWEWARDGGKLMWVWYEEQTDMDMGLDSNGQYEVARLRDADQMREFARCLALLRAAGELYTVTLKTVRADDTNFDWEQ